MAFRRSGGSPRFNRQKSAGLHILVQAYSKPSNIYDGQSTRYDFGSGYRPYFVNRASYMNFSPRSIAIAFLFIATISCNKDSDPSPFVVNASVKPVDFLTANKYTTLNIEVAYV